MILIKLGGSIITNKEKPLSPRKKTIENISKGLRKINEPIIIVHGGGSFGHPMAKKYSISNGFNIKIENQFYGLAKTHEAMVKLNSIVINSFLEKNYPVIPIEPYSTFIKKSKGIEIKNLEAIELTLEMGVTPVLYGDVILDEEKTFSIISGDNIILELCKRLQKMHISKVIFTIDKDGIFIERNGEIEFLNEARFTQIDGLNLANLGKKIDVTGGIMNKLKTIKEIGKLNIPVQILNGLNENFLFKGIIDEKVKSTNIKL